MMRLGQYKPTTTNGNRFAVTVAALTLIHGYWSAIAYATSEHATATVISRRVDGISKSGNWS